MNFLAAMERAVPPPSRLRHSVALASEDGYPKLALLIATGGKPRVLYLDDGDLAKPVDTLVSECVEVLAAAQVRKAANS